MLQVLSYARDLKKSWSVADGSATAAGFAKVHRSIAQLDSLLLADPRHAQAAQLRKWLQGIVRFDLERSRIYATNDLKAKHEAKRYDEYMEARMTPLLGRRCLVPPDVVHLSTTKSGGRAYDEPLEGVVLKHAGGALVWIYLFLERLPYRVWMVDAGHWLTPEARATLLDAAEGPDAEHVAWLFKALKVAKGSLRQGLVLSAPICEASPPHPAAMPPCAHGGTASDRSSRFRPKLASASPAGPPTSAAASCTPSRAPVADSPPPAFLPTPISATKSPTRSKSIKPMPTKGVVAVASAPASTMATELAPMPAPAPALAPLLAPASKLGTVPSPAIKQPARSVLDAHAAIDSPATSTRQASTSDDSDFLSRLEAAEAQDVAKHPRPQRSSRKCSMATVAERKSNPGSSVSAGCPTTMVPSSALSSPSLKPPHVSAAAVA